MGILSQGVRCCCLIVPSSVPCGDARTCACTCCMDVSLATETAESAQQVSLAPLQLHSAQQPELRLERPQPRRHAWQHLNLPDHVGLDAGDLANVIWEEHAANLIMAAAFSLHLCRQIHADLVSRRCDLEPRRQDLVLPSIMEFGGEGTQGLCAQAETVWHYGSSARIGSQV